MNNEGLTDWDKMKITDGITGAPIHIIFDKIKYVERIARPMQEICSDASKSQSKRWELQRLLAEILLDKEQFTDSEWSFMYEFISELMDEYDNKNTHTYTHYASDGL